VVLALGAVVATAVPVFVNAGGGISAVNRQEQASVSSGQKASKAWSDLPGLGNQPVCSVGLVGTNLSLTAAGGAFRVRVKVDGNLIGSAQFDPTRGNRSFSYAFGTNTTDGSHTLEAEWRSAAGDRVALNGGLLTMLYQACTP
jgi:hypothetical protein